LTPNELKKVLQAKGLEIYKTTAEEVVLAERVRDNLLMDSSVAVRAGASLTIRIGVRAQASNFPGEAADRLLARARAAAQSALAAGFSEAGTRTLPIADPGDRSRTIDTWYEVWLERPLSPQADLEAELRAALALEKSAL
jgi:hypothetical protein